MIKHTIISLAGGVEAVFPVMILRRLLTDDGSLNRALALLARQRRATEPSAQISNAGGWQSAATVLDWDMPAIQMIRASILDGVRDVSAVHMGMDPAATRVSVDQLMGWFNINGRGDYNRPHIHPSATWSGVYYIQAGSGGPAGRTSGRLEFLDPRPGAEASPLGPVAHGTRLPIDPVPGLLVLFPSYLMHYVHPFEEDGERITLAFNCVVTEVAPA